MDYKVDPGFYVVIPFWLETRETAANLTMTEALFLCPDKELTSIAGMKSDTVRKYVQEGKLKYGHELNPNHEPAHPYSLPLNHFNGPNPLPPLHLPHTLPLSK
jgi:hypothetical protein